MTIQNQFNNEALNHLPAVKKLIEQADSFESNQMREYSLKTIMNSKTALVKMTIENKNGFEQKLIATFEYRGWIEVDNKMKLLSIANYEIGNGIEVLIEKDDEQYQVYMQLPSCGDSQHSFLDDHDSEEHDLLWELAHFVETQHTHEELSVLTELGTLDYTMNEKNGVYHVIDNDDEENAVDLVEPRVNSYYNIFALVPFQEN